MSQDPSQDPMHVPPPQNQPPRQLPPQGPPMQQPMPPAYQGKPQYLQDAHSKKILAGLLALFLGNLGIHKFVLGYTGAGVITLLVSLSCIGAFPMRVISFIEGIMYLTKSDEDFYRLYIQGRKEWF